MRKKRQLSRRRRALRYAVRAAAALALVNHFLMVGLLFPGQALRRSEERQGTGRTAVVLREWAPELHWSQRLYLTENENVTMFSGAQLTWMGWTDTSGVALDCSEDAPLYGGWWTLRNKEGLYLFYAFGRIDSPDVARVEVQVQLEEWQSGKVVRRTAFSWTSERKDWVEKEGRQYFLFRKYPFDTDDYPSSVHCAAIGYDEAGNEIARLELEQGYTSLF